MSSLMLILGIAKHLITSTIAVSTFILFFNACCLRSSEGEILGYLGEWAFVVFIGAADREVSCSLTAG